MDRIFRDKNKFASESKAEDMELDVVDSLLNNNRVIELNDDTEQNNNTGIEELKSRTTWVNKTEYLLSLIGYTVGLSNLWRFPYLCMKNGGGAFLIPFVFFMVVCGLPLYIFELAVGQFSGKSAMVVWSICPLFKGLGFSVVIVTSIITWYNGAVIAWVLYYFIYSFYPNQPWSSCNSNWNSPNCTVFQLNTNEFISREYSFLNVSNPMLENTTAASSYSYSSFLNISRNVTADVNKTTLVEGKVHFATAAFEFWRYKVLDISSGIDDIGPIQWQMVLLLLGAYVISFLSIIKGVRSVGKIVYVTALLPYLLLTIILCRSLTLDGSLDGVLFFITPNFAKLLDFQVWLEAALQVFFSLGPGWGGVITMASYNNFNNNFIRDGVIVTVCDAFTALFCGLVVFSTLGYQAKESGLTIQEAAESGPGLIFISYPEILAKLPLPQLWSVLFFTMVIMLGIDSQFGNLETVISGLTDLYPRQLRQKKYLLLSLVFSAYFITSLIFATRAGVYIFVFIDWYASAFTIFFTTMLECIILGWIYGAERFSQDIELMIGKSLSLPLRISMCIVTPMVLFVILVLTIANYSHATYKGYIYPNYTGPLGLLIASVSVLPVPGVLLWQIYTSKGTLKSRLSSLVMPTNWRPHHSKLCQNYTKYKYGPSVAKNIKLNLLGRKLR